MIDPNNPTNLNPQDLSDQQNAQVDPSFLPKGSNVYIRTMNTDLSNLKNQGGEALPYVENPVVVPEFSSPVGPTMTTTDAPAPIAYPSPSPIPPTIPSVEAVAPVAMTESPVAFMPTTPPEIKNDFSQNITANPEPMIMPTEIPVVNPIAEMQPSTLDNLKQKINELNPSLNPEPLKDVSLNNDPINIDNLSANLNTDLENPTTFENIGLISDINPKGKEPKSKSKLILIAGALGLILLIAIIIFVIRPKMMSPKISLNPLEDKNNLTPPTTLVAEIPATLTPFLRINNPFEVSNLNIDISRLTQVTDQIKTEGNSLLAPNTFKVIVPKIKNEYLTSIEIANLLLENLPQSLITNLGEKYLLYAFYGEVHPALGIILQVKSDALESVKTELLAWETNRNMVKNTSKLWLFTPKTSKAKTFKESELLSATIRSFEYPEKEASLSYTLWNNYIIITTSLESMSSALTHVQNGDTPVIK